MKLIITADWHLRSTKPTCRLDENWEVLQKKVLRHIIQYANHENAHLCINGDLFDTSVVPPRVSIMFLHQIKKAKNTVYLIPGNHDLPYHSWKKVNDSSIGVFLKTDYVKLPEKDEPAPGILFVHRLVFASADDAPPNSKGITAKKLLEENPGYKWIFTGDNHKAFIYKHKGRYVVNPGCIIRQKADLKDYTPKFYIVDLETEQVDSMFTLDIGNLVTDNYLQIEKERKERIGALIEVIQKKGSVSLDFEENLESSFDALEAEVVAMIEEIRKEAKKS